MSLDEKFIPVRTTFYEIIGNFFQENSWIFWLSRQIRECQPFLIFQVKFDARSKFLDNLPRHRTFWPPIQRPESMV